MAYKRHSMGPNECSTSTQTSNLGGTVSHTLHRHFCIHVLFSMRDTPFLANIDPIYDLPHHIQGFNIRDFEPSFKLLPVATCVVIVCILFSSPVTQNSRATADEEIHIRISSPWYNLPWGVCRLCY